jgi:hypothetical protein
LSLPPDFLLAGSAAAGCDDVGMAEGAVEAGGDFLADFDIEILRSIHGGISTQHHRSPAAAITAAGQDLWALGRPNWRQ